LINLYRLIPGRGYFFAFHSINPKLRIHSPHRDRQVEIDFNPFKPNLYDPAGPDFPKKTETSKKTKSQPHHKS